MSNHSYANDQREDREAVAQSLYDKSYPRRLQVYSLDPAADVRLDTAMISRCVLNVEWEDVKAGPIGDYVEVIDYDPASGCGYKPVDLDGLLATDGLSPSTGNPQFHQQMVYAIAMLTIKNFERILGRRVVWSERSRETDGGHIRQVRRRFVQRLRIYPHALRQQNAYYSPAKKALLFGYFNAPTEDPRAELPGGLVFTCLSHDIIAHETTHAILDGIHPRLLDASNDDMLAFHEAFADVVAIFQHFALPDLLLDQVQKTRGELSHNNLLAQLASQFARSTNRGQALRNALGTFDEHGKREPPDPTAYAHTKEPHARGAILVAAIFDAFLRIYEDRVADLLRIATGGTGVLPAGDIHPDLAQRFAAEAVKAANRVLTICVRAIDYLPPVDVTFGDYLRALITADADVVPDDPRRYRLAFIESFRERGIYPLDVRTLSEESLRWSRPTDDEANAIDPYLPSPNMLRTMAYAYEASAQPIEERERLLSDFVAGKTSMLRNIDRSDLEKAETEFLKHAWGLAKARRPSSAGGDERKERLYKRFLLDRYFRIVLHRWINAHLAQPEEVEADADEDEADSDGLQSLELGLGLDLAAAERYERGERGEDAAPIEVHAIRPTTRTRPDGRTRTELLVVLTQRLFKEISDDDEEVMRDARGDKLSFKYRGGCTLIIDPEDGRVEYAISKCLSSKRRRKRQQAFLRAQVENAEQDAVTRFGLTGKAAGERLRMEPFALAHTNDPSLGGLY